MDSGRSKEKVVVLLVDMDIDVRASRDSAPVTLGVLSASSLGQRGQATSDRLDLEAICSIITQLQTHVRVWLVHGRDILCASLHQSESNNGHVVLTEIRKGNPDTSEGEYPVSSGTGKC
jgi:hypothetical protein